MEREIEEGIIADNELIALFMGLVRHEANSIYNLPRYMEKDENDGRKKGRFMGYPEQLKYHSSWDWLHDVYEKIHQQIKNKTPKCNTPHLKDYHEGYDDRWKEWSIWTSKLLWSWGSLDINKAHNYAIKFIKWYNNQN